eukprot:GHVS01061196.1.p2 GENE.GHVS01061196.1~~GHVS01061196.1.p2  ORF type:complete len:123 (-),score=13.88 GHVS01061196.1:2191-2559(-)
MAIHHLLSPRLDSLISQRASTDFDSSFPRSSCSSAPHGSSMQFPYLGLLVSGGHTLVVVVEDVGKYTPLSATVDDAIGEAFDKVARRISKSLTLINVPGGFGLKLLGCQRLQNPSKFVLLFK